MADNLLPVACIQLCSDDRLDSNWQKVSRLIRQAADQGAQLLLLPENFALMGVDHERKLDFARHKSAQWLADIGELCVAHHITVIAGGIITHTTSQPGLHNSAIVIGPDGNIASTYHKMHLFDVDLATESHRESDSFAAGDSAVMHPLDADWKIGLSICYDLRFPELYRHNSAHGCNILVVPAAFTHTTGEAHWEALLRARAIENQCYVLAAAQSGIHPKQRRTWGHSMVIDPWGKIIACLKEGEGIIQATLSLSYLKHVRQILPALKHRRPVH